MEPTAFPTYTYTSTYTAGAPPSPAPTASPGSTPSSRIQDPGLALTPRTQPASTLPRPTSKPVEIRFHSQTLRGSLHRLPSDAFLNVLFARFLDIPPTELAIADVHTPHVMIHAALGRSWCGASQLPFSTPKSSGEQFVAVTNDDWFVGDGPEMLGQCSLDGTFTPAPPISSPFDPRFVHHTFPGFLADDYPHHANNLILFLPYTTPLPKPFRLSSGAAGRSRDDIPIYPPYPVTPSLLHTIALIRHALDDPASSTASGTAISKRWLDKHLKPHVLDQQTGLLRPDHPLWQMRGNVALWKSSLWAVLCCQAGKSVRAARERGALPAPWWMDVFEDVRERERTGEGEGLI